MTFPVPGVGRLELASDACRPRPLTALDVTGAAPPELAEQVAAAADRGDVVVGVAAGGVPDPALLDDLTLTLSEAATDDPRVVPVADGEAALAELRMAAEAHPDAVAVLAAHLRHSGRLTVPAALVAESTAYSLLLTGRDHARWLAGRPPRPHRRDPRPVTVRRDGDRLEVTLSRPQRRNAFDAATRDALLEALAVAAADPALRVVLRGAGPAFCSGGDLDEFGTATDAVNAHLLRTTRSVGLALHRIADRVSVQVHGACIGAGTELAAFAGHVVAAPDATFRLPELAMGLIPGAGGTVSLPRRIGRWRTAWLALTGATLDAGTAMRWGLADALA